ncbi:hypothetical protein Leryth_018927 [Lithospermum erythrorhizon]|nr:hypothetical protein Leryth_018927 [Lithospermum erythrorhizon]
MIIVKTFIYVAWTITKASISTDNNYNQPTPVGLGSIRFEFLDDEFDENDQKLYDFDLYVPHLELMGT